MAGLFPFFLAQANDPNSYAGFLQMILVTIAMFSFFYLILYRPEKKRREFLEKQRAMMQTGDKVIAMGILGVVDSIKEDTVILKMVDGSKIEVLKAAITNVDSKENTKPS